MSSASETDFDVLDGLVFADGGELTAEAAEALLRIRFDRKATKRMQELLRKNQAGSITAEERLLLEKFVRVAKTIDVLQAKATLALKRQESA